MIGFSEHVDLGDVGVLRDDPTVALRFEVSHLFASRLDERMLVAVAFLERGDLQALG